MLTLFERVDFVLTKYRFGDVFHIYHKKLPSTKRMYEKIEVKGLQI
jgi:hypothetical protein